MVKIGLGFLLTAMIGFGLGYWLVPTKIVIKTKTEYVERRIIVKDTTTTTTKKPDGTTVIVVENKDKINENKEGKSDTTTTREREKLDWMVGAAYLTKLDGNKTILGTVQRRIIGEIFVGVYATSTGSGGVGITIRF